MRDFRGRSRALRASQTSAEARLWQALRNRKFARWKFRRQHPIGRYIVDFVTLAGKLTVEVDGVTHSEPDEVAKDADRTRIFESFGFHVIRISNMDVYENLNGVLELIHAELKVT